jgi:hypothetical protein
MAKTVKKLLASWRKIRIPSGTRISELYSDRHWGLHSSCPLPAGGKEAGASIRHFISLCAHVKNVQSSSAAARHVFIVLCLSRYMGQLWEICSLSFHNINTNFPVTSSLIGANILLGTLLYPQFILLHQLLSATPINKRVKL